MNTEKVIDIIDVCNLLQTLGFNIKEIYKESNLFEDKSGKTLQLKCNFSGIKVIMESKISECNCTNIDDENCKWEMSGTSGGKQITTIENNTGFHKSISKDISANIQNNIIKLLDIIRQDQSNVLSTKITNNLSLSSSCLHESPPRLAMKIKVDTPSRYRSLDTLNDKNANILPQPRELSEFQKPLLDSNLELGQNEEIKFSNTEKINTIVRQNTYTTSPTEHLIDKGTSIPSRTSSPVPIVPTFVLFNLHQAEKLNDEMGLLIQEAIKSIEKDNETDDKSSFIMNMSKISNKKMIEPRARTGSTVSSRSVLPYVSSPNLSRIQESKIGNNSNRRLSYKTIKSELKVSSLRQSIPKRISSLKSISPTFNMISNKKSVDGGKLSGNLKVTPKSSSIITKPESEPKKKNSLYNHIKSTIPRHISSSKK